MENLMNDFSINVTTPSIIGSDLDEARNGLKVSARSTGESIAFYSKVMDKYFDLRDNDGNVTTKWFDRKGKLGVDVKAEKEKLKAIFPECAKGERPNKALGEFSYGTGDVYWQRTKIESGYETPAMKAAKGNTEKKGIVDMCKAELATMLNRINKARADKPEGLDRMLEVYEELEVVFCTLGGNPDTDLK
jgi:hypothetical protein